MDFTNYLDKKVQIILKNGFTYIGKCVDTDNNSITIIDKTSSQVCIKEDSIDLIKEVLE